MSDKPAENILPEPDIGGSSLRRPLMLGGVIVALLMAAYFYFTGGRYVETENAQLQTSKVMIAANVSGRVISVEVQENQLVKAGQVLFRIDPSNFEVGVSSAEAAFSGAIADISSTQADLVASRSEVAKAQSELVYAQGEAARQQSLLKEGISSQAQVDQAILAVRKAQASIATAQAKVAAVAARVPAGSATAQPSSRGASAALEQARISLNDTIVRAPQDGIVTRVNQLQVGSYVSAGKPLFGLSGTRFWVESNFKENQLRYMRIGQPATIKIDAFPDANIKGKVASFSPGTGNTFSVLPAENATGNWVKVTQRLPVIISLESLPKDTPLHAGLSVQVTVDTGHKRY